MQNDIKKIIAPAVKVKVATEALKEAETPGQLASKYAVHPIQIGLWKKIAKEAIEQAFAQKRQKDETRSHEELTRELFEKIGKLEVENEFLKKKIGILE